MPFGLRKYYHCYYRFKPCLGLAAFLLLAGVKPADVFAIQRYESPFMSDTFLNFINNTRTLGVGFTLAITPKCWHADTRKIRARENKGTRK